jgi:hypothetical protein
MSKAIYSKTHSRYNILIHLLYFQLRQLALEGRVPLEQIEYTSLLLVWTERLIEEGY